MRLSYRRVTQAISGQPTSKNLAKFPDALFSAWATSHCRMSRCRVGVKVATRKGDRRTEHGIVRADAAGRSR